MAVSGSNDDPMLVKRRSVFRDRLSAALGLPVKLYESSDYNGVIQAISSGQVDLAQIAGGGYANVDAQVGSLVAPILTPRQAEGETGYYSALVVRADSPIRPRPRPRRGRPRCGLCPARLICMRARRATGSCDWSR